MWSAPTLALNETTNGPDSESLHALQLLLEQEVLLETFAEETTAKRKSEDAQTSRENLETRGEINRIVEGAVSRRVRREREGRERSTYCPSHPPPATSSANRTHRR